MRDTRCENSPRRQIFNQHFRPQNQHIYGKRVLTIAGAPSIVPIANGPSGQGRRTDWEKSRCPRSLYKGVGLGKSEANLQ